MNGMDGWMDGRQTERWMEGRQIDRWIDGWMDGMDGWIKRLMDGWKIDR